MNFEQMKYIFLVLINQFNINEFQKFMVWLDKLVEDYKLNGSIANYQFDMQISCTKCNKELSNTNDTERKKSTKKQFNNINEASSHNKCDDSVYLNQIATSGNDILSNTLNGVLSTCKKLTTNNLLSDHNQNDDYNYTEASDWNALNEDEMLEPKEEPADNEPTTGQSPTTSAQNDLNTTADHVISDCFIQKKRSKGFSALQKYELEKLFSSKKYISTEERIDLAKRLDLTQVQIKDWFKNHRKLMRRSLEQQYKKQTTLISNEKVNSNN